MSIADQIERASASDAIELVHEIDARVSASVAEARSVAEAFPISHSDREVCAALAKLALRLAPFTPRLPTLDDAELRPRWDAAACAATSSVVDTWSDDRVLKALRFLRPQQTLAPGAVIARLAQISSDDALRALEWASASVALGALDSSDALELLEPLSRHDSSDVRACFVDALAEPWLALTDRVRFYRRALADEDVDVARRALLDADVEPERVRELRGHAELRDEAAIALARLGDASDLAESLSVRAAVLRHHRAGRFPKPADVSPLVEAFLDDRSWTEAELTRVLYTCRAELLDELEAIPTDDERWRRLAGLLAHVEGTSSSGLTGPDLLAKRLRASTDPDVSCAFLRAAADCPSFDDEDALRGHLDAIPEDGFDALMRHGTAASLEPVLKALRDPLAFGAARRAALDWCWMVAPDRLALVAEHGADSWTDEQLARVNPKHAASVERARAASRGVEPLVALNLIAGVVDVDLDELSDPFRAAVRAEVVVHGARRPRDPAVPTGAETAILRAESRLAQAGRRLTRFQDAGPGRLIRVLALDWLGESVAADDVRDIQLALGILARHPLASSQLRFVHPLWRHPNPDVQRSAAEALLRCQHADGLALSLSNLASTGDVRTTRQGLRAIEHFGSHWAEASVIEALDSPNMNIKKSAASALQVVGTSRCVPAVLRWIAAYDNPGFRESLLIALESVAGNVANALLLTSFERATRAQHENMLAALQDRLNVEQLASYVHRTNDERLANACRDGVLRLSDGSWGELADRLHRYSPTPPTSATAVDLLEREGFSPERAQAALDEGSPRLVAAIRWRLPEWARWAAESGSPKVARAVLDASVEIHPEHALILVQHVASLSGARTAIRALVRVAQAVPPGGFFKPKPHRPSTHWAKPSGSPLRVRTLRVRDERRGRSSTASRVREAGPSWRRRAIELVRALEISQHEQWRALRKLGAVVTREDLGRAFDAAVEDGALRELLADALPLHWQVVLMLPPEERRERALELWSHGALSVTRRYVSRAARVADVPALQDVLEGRVTPTDPDVSRRLARELRTWPVDEHERRRANTLLRYVPLHRLRRWLGDWIQHAVDGDSDALATLRYVPLEELLAHPDFTSAMSALASSRNVARDARLAGLMWRHRFGPDMTAKAMTPAEPEPVDPLDEVEGADALLTYAEKARGREASRAVGRLGKLGATDHVRRALSHKDSNPRTVAMRWLRKLMDRDSYLQLALEQLGSERDPHLRRSLLRSVAHRYPPAWPHVIQLVLDSDARIAREALEAVRRLGDAILPDVEHAIAHERPDRARRLRELLA